MAFYFCGDGTTDVACSFEEDGEARWLALAGLALAAILAIDAPQPVPAGGGGGGSGQPYAQQWVLEPEPQMFAAHLQLFALAEGVPQAGQDAALALTVYRGPSWAAYYKGALSDPQIYLGAGVLH
jgi:hypothetical protein